MRPTSLIWAAFVMLCAASAMAKRSSGVPKRQIPPAVVAELRLLEYRFGQALTQDCAPERCFAKGCVYVAHTVIDQPAAASLPGLGLDPGPGSVPRQVFLTMAECSFAHEKSVRPRNVRALANRLKAKLSGGWIQVEMTHEALEPLPEFIRDSPEPPPEPPEPPPQPPAPEENAAVEPIAEPPEKARETWDAPIAGRELWLSLLPHFSWMIALVMLTFAGLIVIWALRRLGRQSPEEQALLAQMLHETGSDAAAGGSVLRNGVDSGAVGPSEAPTPGGADVSEQFRIWRARLATTGDTETDPALQALVTDLLRTGERRLLAKAVMLFPEEFPKAFPEAGNLASEKFELAEFLKSADTTSLPSDDLFFEKLNRYALSSSLTAQADTDLIRGLHDEFGATALADAVAAMPGRYGALLFALAPEATQYEAVGLLSQSQVFETVDQLMRSNRMDSAENDYLLSVLAALRVNDPVPTPPEARSVSDRGTEFNATATLSILLPRLDTEGRAYVVNATVSRLNGRLPTWIEGTLYGEMLLELDQETRTDLLLDVDASQLAAWLQLQTADARARLLDGAPVALQAALQAGPAPTSQTALFALANDGRAALSAALQQRLLRGDILFQALLI